MKYILVLCIVALLVALTSGYSMRPAFAFRNDQSLGMFGGGKAAAASAKAITITVDGKTIESSSGKEGFNLRKELQQNKVDVYSFTGKFNNCGGSGICGKCAVKVLDGAKNISPASKNEQNTIKVNKLASDNRLSCCARVTGPISIKCVKPL